MTTTIQGGTLSGMLPVVRHLVERGRESGLSSPEAQFRTLYDAHVAAITRYAVRRVSDPADAADIVAETFLVLWRRLDDVPDGAELPWLYGVAKFALANQHRSTHRRSALVDRLGDELAVRVQADRAQPPGAGDESRIAQVRAAMEELSEADQEILRLVAWEGLGHQDVAAVLGCSQPTARVRLHRARARLRRAVDRQGGTDDTPPARAAARSATPLTQEAKP